MTGASDLDQRYRFERRGLDANDDRLGAWGADAFSRPAKATWLRGGEGVLQQRLAGSQPVILTVRDEAAVRAVDNAWRAVDVRSLKTYEVKSASPAKEPGFVDILAVEVKGDDD